MYCFLISLIKFKQFIYNFVIINLTHPQAIRMQGTSKNNKIKYKKTKLKKIKQKKMQGTSVL